MEPEQQDGYSRGLRIELDIPRASQLQSGAVPVFRERGDYDHGHFREWQRIRPVEQVQQSVPGWIASADRSQSCAPHELRGTELQRGNSQPSISVCPAVEHG